jgi:UDP-N-acetylglucosamine:LPS N-acetylglucosamine transferase
LTVTKKHTIDFMFFDAGGGHRSAANGLLKAIDMQQLPWDPRMVNLQFTLERLDAFYKVTGIRLEDLYNIMLKKGWTLGSAQLLTFMQQVVRLFHNAHVKELVKHWNQTKPDMVVSLVPNFNRCMYQAVQRLDRPVPYVTVMTDIADYPPHFWIERDQNQYIICGSAKAEQQALGMGHPRERVFRTSGMILNPKYYEVPEVDRAAERTKLGLQDLPTGLVMFGGQGSASMVEILDRLEASGLKLQLIMICGKNTKLAGKLRARNTKMPVFIEGFTDQVPYYMRVSDFFIGKPGPGSISEAVSLGLPVLVESNMWTLPQERYNAQWVVENQIGESVSSFKEVVEAVGRLLQGDTLQRYRDNATRMQNRAVFEIPEILRKILEASR